MAQDPYRYFRVEARELIDQLGKGVLDLERAPVPDLVPRLLRLAHTLKGAARVVRQATIAEHAHGIEEALAPHRDVVSAVPRDRIDGLLAIVDAMGNALAAIDLPAQAVPVPGPRPAGERAVADRAVGERSTAERGPREEPLRTVRADVTEMDALLDGLAQAHTRLAGVRRGLGRVGEATRMAERIVGELAARPGRERGLAGDPGTVGARSGARVLAFLEEMTGHLHGAARELTGGVEHIDRELAQVREAAERLRLVPAGIVFTALERTARDAAHALQRRVLFEGRGGDVRLDAHVLGAVQGALVQVVRNAVAHGVENEAERVRSGKPAEGRITLEVARRGRRVTFTCTDDGRGVDLDAVRTAVERKGLSPAGMGNLDAEALLRALLRSGISTSREITEVAGRGIGLDVLRETAERVGGEVDVRTEAGKGTTVALIVPVSLASIEALNVEAVGTVASIPLDAVRRTIRLRAADIATTSAGESIVYEGKVLPFVPLARVLALDEGAERGARARSAVVVESTRGAAAIGVDRMLGTSTIVLRALPEWTPVSPIVAGASLDAEGRPQIILDPDALIAEVEHASAPLARSEPARAPILVIDDSLTTRMLEKSILESAGYTVDVAASAEEGLEKARRAAYALFLVDVEMPGMDGFAFIERIREDARLRDIPAILVTSRSAPADRRRGEEVGAQGYMVKSEFDQRDLLVRIARFVA